MKQTEQMKMLLKIGYVSAFAALAFIGTTVLRIPIPASGGYFNLGDTFVMIAALLYGPVVGLFVGLLGPTLSDAIGFPQFILATAVVKSIEGFAVGVIGYKATGKSRGRVLFSLIIGMLIIVIGYFIFEAYIYPAISQSIPFFGVTDRNAAIGELFPNLLQGLFSGILAYGLWMAFKGRKNN